MRRILICFSLALLVAAMVPAAAQTLPPEDPGEYTGPQWFPEPPELIFQYVIEHPGPAVEEEPPEGLIPMSQPGAGSPGRKASSQGQSTVSVSNASAAGGSVVLGSSLGGSFDPRTELEVRVRDARRALDH
jgi:hypothetical protein